MINLTGIMSPNNHIDRTMGIIAVSTAVIGGATSIYAANKNAGIAKDAAAEARIEREKQQALLKKQQDEYKAMEFKNPFSNMENTFEDLTVNQQQAQFQAQQGSQQRANIMQNLRGAAGSSGIAGLAQSLANQGALQTQQISASIGQQESRNQMAAARGASAVQVAMGQTTGANLAHQQAQANQMNAQMAQNQAWGDSISNVGSTAVQAGKNDMFAWQGKGTKKIEG